VRPLRELRPEVPEELTAVVNKMMTRNPASRFQVPTEVAAALVPFIKGTKPLPGEATSFESGGKSPDRNTNASRAVPRQSTQLHGADPWSVIDGTGAERTEGRRQRKPPAAKRRTPGHGKWLWFAALIGVAFLLAVVGVGAVVLKGGGGQSKQVIAEVRERPALLDCTGREGVSAADAGKAQEAWAKYLGRNVKEEIKLADGTTLTFSLVPPGKFQMGSPEREKDRNADEELHEVTLTAPFYLGMYAVTQAQYEAVMKTNPSNFKGVRLPVETVSWEEAHICCRELSRITGQNVVLPTEAQWEYACRAGTKSQFNFGSTLNGDLANCDGRFPYGTDEEGPYLGKTTEVGSYKQNAWGLWDMHGNVMQWCSDWYGDYSLGRVTDPRGASGDSFRVIRGGSWLSLPWCCRSAYRRKCNPSTQSDGIGFRVALIPTGS
jgi:formylglycine-generating enzyme required for sulfatase activity